MPSMLTLVEIIAGSGVLSWAVAFIAHHEELARRLLDEQLQEVSQAVMSQNNPVSEIIYPPFRQPRLTGSGTFVCDKMTASGYCTGGGRPAFCSSCPLPANGLCVMRAYAVGAA